MKRIIFAILSAAIAPAVFSAEYSVFRVCEDKHVLRTSDGADAGRVEYIVLEPSSQRVVSTIVTGGVVGPKFVAVPFTSMQFTNDHEIALTEITRERIVSAPVIERTQITSAAFEPSIIQRTNNHFNVRVDATSRQNVDVQERDRSRAGGANAAQQAAPGGQSGRAGAPVTGTQPGEKMPPDAPATAQKQKRTTESGSRQPGQNPPGIGEKLPDKDRPNERNADRVDEPRGQGEKQEGQPKGNKEKQTDSVLGKGRDETAPVKDQVQPLKDQVQRKGLKEQSPSNLPDSEKKKPRTEEPHQ